MEEEILSKVERINFIQKIVICFFFRILGHKTIPQPHIMEEEILWKVELRHN